MQKDINVVVPWPLPVVAGVAVLALHVLLWFGGWYVVIPWIDIPMHLAGGFIVAMAVLAAVPLLRWGRTPAELSVLILATVTTVAVFWEFCEYACDQLFGTGLQRSIGDTLKDIALAILAALYVISWHRRRSLERENQEQERARQIPADE